MKQTNKQLGFIVKTKEEAQQKGYQINKGYTILVRKIKGKTKKIRVHRFIMEKYLGRKLGRFELVHHINKNKLDNRITNLQLVTPEEHATIHFAGKRDRKTTKGDHYQK